MAGKDQGKEKPSKSRQSKRHLKRSIHKNPSSLKPSALSHTTTLSPRTSHDAPRLGISLVARRLRSSRAAPPPVTSHIPPPPKASRVAPAHNTSQVPLPPKSSRVAQAHNTSQVAPPPKASHVAPSSTSHAAPSFRTFHATPPSSTSRIAPSRTSHVTLSHVAPPLRTSATAPSHRTSHVIPARRTSHVTRLPRTSPVTPPSTRGVESPSNSQSSHSEGAHTPGSSETIVASETQSNGGKKTLYLDGQGFLPSHPAANGIGDIIRTNFTEPWPSWKKIHVDTRDLWFAEFKKQFSFCPPDDVWARKNFERRGATVLKNNLNKVRSQMNRPTWIRPAVWSTLCDHWGTHEFKKKSIQAKKNRASDRGGFGGSFHTCGSITTSQHRANMTELNGTPPNPSDLFLYTHRNRKNNTWVDSRSEHVHGEFTQRLEELTQASSLQGNPPPKELDVWCEVAGINKGRVYGLGMESTVLVGKGRPNYRGSCSLSTEWVQRNEFEEMRNERDQQRHEFEEMRKERDQLRKELAKTNRAVEQNNQMLKQLMESLNFRHMSHTRDRVHDDDDEVGDDDDTGGEYYDEELDSESE